jgi:SET and MYND domain-containing protein 4
MNLAGLKGKSNQKAEALRLKGVQALEQGELYEAILKFNKSLCLAERCSKTIGMIFAGRAEAFSKLHMYDKCLNNVQLAKEENLDPDTKELMNELEELSLNYVFGGLVLYENPWEFFKLSYPANEKLPNVVNCLEVKSDEKYGRYIITNQALNVGDVIAIEKPFFKILKTDPDDDEYPETNIYQYCANCINDNFMDLIPCSFCLTTMFCSQKCLEEANKGFHQYECSILQPLNETGNWRMAIRCFFDALSICNGSIEELEFLMKQSDESSPTVFNFNFQYVKSSVKAKRYLTCMLALERRVEVKSRDFSSIFNLHPSLSKLWDSHKDFINRFLERMMQIEILNFHGIKGRSLDRKNPYRSCLGDGGYPFCSLFNHSCCPNVMRIVVQNHMVLVVERPIKKGEQIFDCYIG